MTYRPTTLIGIDPGTLTGLAVKHDATLVACRSADFWEAVEIVRDAIATSDCALVIEDARRMPRFARNRKAGESAEHAASVGRSIGVTDAHSALWETFAIHHRIPYLLRTPAKKWDIGIFQHITGYHKRTSQHARDAARLIYTLPPRPSWILPPDSRFSSTSF